MWSIPQALQAGFDRLTHIFGPAVETAAALFPIQPIAELGRDHQLVAAPLDGLGQEGLVVAGAVDVGGVKEGDPQFDSPVEGLQRLSFVSLAIDVGQAHAAEPLGADGERTERSAVCVGHGELPWTSDDLSIPTKSMGIVNYISANDRRPSPDDF
jgi:hypothetical protein